MSDENALTGSVTPEPTPTPEATTEAPEAQVQTGETTEASEPQKTEESDKPKSKSRAKERIEELARSKRNLARQLARANQEIGRLRAEQAPREEDYQSPADYQREAFKRAAKEAALEGQFESARSEMEMLKTRRQEIWSERVAEAVAQMPDFETVFDANVPVSEAMADLIPEMENGTEVAYYLGKNRQHAARIAQMSPVEAALELGRLEARLSIPKAKTVSTAPPPVSTVSGKAAVAPRDLYALAKSEDATEFIKESRRRAQGA